ncbi:hypothetical protein FRC08_004392 [Ceratobasidium sp. 394]|nr:hypothetical protein FRC08_004392 [Ceratobasidium sp. 394]
MVRDPVANPKSSPAPACELATSGFEARSSRARAQQLPIELPALERLELSGAFVSLTNLFTTYSFPKLDYLLLNSLDPLDSICARLAAIASRSPALRQLNISSSDTSLWVPAAEHLPLLQEVTTFDMIWDSAILILIDFSELVTSSFSRLSQLYGHPPSEEAGSGESERSYDEDEGCQMGDWQ